MSLNISLTHEAESGREALELLEKAHDAGQPIDLVFCDWNMPILSGIQLLRLMKGDPKFMNIPVIMVTVKKDSANVMAALCEGAIDYIVKPFAKEVFLRKLANVNQKLSKKPGRSI